MTNTGEMQILPTGPKKFGDYLSGIAVGFILFSVWPVRITEEVVVPRDYVQETLHNNIVTKVEYAPVRDYELVKVTTSNIFRFISTTSITSRRKSHAP